MNSVRKSPPVRMTREEFLDWAGTRNSGKYERIDGVVVSMPPKRLSHSARKSRIYNAFQNAIDRAGLPCEAYVDGPTVSVEDCDFVPDVVVRCGPPLEDGLVIPDPLVVVEVLSPNTPAIDLGRKRASYFLAPSLQHYLAV
jgi:Uma2 family endonuclease